MNVRTLNNLYKIAIFLTSILTFCISSAEASDWGYEDEAKSNSKPAEIQKIQEIQPQKAIPGKLKPDTKATKPSTMAPVAQKPPATVQSWLELLGLISQSSAELPEKFSADKLSSQLQGDQGERFRKVLAEHIQDAEVAKIQNYWGQLKPKLNDMDQRDNYRLLLRALLRMKAAKMEDSNPIKDVILEALGPDRIAISGNTSLSEDAIGAYTDMTCLLYEKTHPGKTVDADDNREIFAQLVRNKFEQAPTEADKKAMNAFPLTWSIFRILYTNASEAERDKMSRELAESNKLSNLKITDKTLALVLSQFPK